ncbi:hypothetical protein JTB14_002374 [Gonioctena quinquepunctata]|nr:hypothetical protein JTB14_002374 [Gonioctena quinquepunctata]
MSPTDGVHEANEENDEMLQQIEKTIVNLKTFLEVLRQIENKTSEFEEFSRNDEMLQQIENENQTDQPYCLRNRHLIKRPERFGKFNTRLSCLSGQGDPVTFKGAVEGENGNTWKEAIKSEFEALEENKTWTEMDLTVNKHTIDNK